MTTDWRDPNDPTGWGMSDLHPELYTLSFGPDLPNPYGRKPGLTKAESRWLEQAATEEGVPRRARRPDHAARQLAKGGSDCALALANATVEVPPPNRRELGTRGNVGPSDPALAQIVATHQAIERAAVRLGHVLDDCLLCDTPDAPLSCNSPSSLTVAAVTGLDLSELADHLVGLSATSPKALRVVAGRLVFTFDQAADAAVDVWDRMNRGGAETDQLRDYVGQIVEVTGRLGSVKGMLSQWLPGAQVRMCKNVGCRRPAPALKPGAVERGGAQCRACVDAAYEARNRPA